MIQFLLFLAAAVYLLGKVTPRTTPQDAVGCDDDDRMSAHWMRELERGRIQVIAHDTASSARVLPFVDHGAYRKVVGHG